MLLDILFPPLCFGCARWGTYLCTACVKKLRYYTNNRCIGCRKYTYLGFSHEKCCNTTDIAGNLAVFAYAKPVRNIIKALKYRGLRSALDELLFSLDPTLLESFYQFRIREPEAMLQAVPLHPQRLHIRGFNQSVFLVRFFSFLLGYKSIDCLDRTRNTPAQAGLRTIEEREENMRGAFTLRTESTLPPVVILVDDVITTGSTCKEAARVLKNGGVERVYVFSLARR